MAVWILLNTVTITLNSQSVTEVSGTLVDDTSAAYPLIVAAGGTFIAGSDTIARAARNVVYYARRVGGTAAQCDQLMQSVNGAESADLATVVYGTGAGGVVNFDGVTTNAISTLNGSTYTLTANAQLADGSVIATGVTVNPAGYAIFCNGTLTNNGTISFSGNNASGRTGGAATVAAFLNAGAPGGAGGLNNLGTTGRDSLNAFKLSSAYGGAGGGVTANSIARVSSFRPTYIGGPYGMLLGLLYTYQKNATTLLVPLLFGGHGGDGGDSAGASANAGAGGSGGGCALVVAKSFVNNGTILATGGNGSAASGSGNAGGGGGGAGGSLFLISSSAMTGTGTLNVAGGNGGAGIGTGSSGLSGSSGIVNCYYL